jgi:hypothetical protein
MPLASRSLPQDRIIYIASQDGGGKKKLKKKKKKSSHPRMGLFSSHPRMGHSIHPIPGWEG